MTKRQQLEFLETVKKHPAHGSNIPFSVFTTGSPLQRPQSVAIFGSNYGSTKHPKRLLSLLSSLYRPIMPHILPPGFLFSATLFTTSCLRGNSQSLTSTWHAYNQDQVKALSSTKACERYYNSSTPEKNNTGFSAGLSELRLWPGKVALLQL